MISITDRDVVFVWLGDRFRTRDLEVLWEMAELHSMAEINKGVINLY